ncbi:MAG: hypothetical protein NVV67_05810 [Pseudoxanthomonas sp.]|nr:hypothetical protein [Pseudoxanthomonas sp.]
MKILVLRTDGIETQEDSLEIAFTSFNYTKAAATHLARLIAGNGVQIKPVAWVSTHQAAAIMELVEGDLQIAEPLWKAVAQTLRNSLEEVISRYAAAFLQQKPMQRIGHDLAALAFNRIAREALAAGAEFWMFPGTALEWRFEPTDPAMLACPEPIDVTYDRIDSALVSGVREVNGPQRELFDPSDEVEVVISLRHRLAEIRHTTTLQKAQAIWRGETRLSADVRIRPGEMPEVVGDVTLTRG